MSMLRRIFSIGSKARHDRSTCLTPGKGYEKGCLETAKASAKTVTDGLRPDPLSYQMSLHQQMHGHLDCDLSQRLVKSGASVSRDSKSNDQHGLGVGHSKTELSNTIKCGCLDGVDKAYLPSYYMYSSRSVAAVLIKPC